HDAEDAFQATFLILARKGSSIHQRESVGGWLYQVAYRVAVKARTNSVRRQARERKAEFTPPADPLLDMNLKELRAVLYEELHRMPEKYRAPLVLCYLEEKTQEEAARQLGWTKGAVKGRLDRGRDHLRARLRRRGLDLSMGLFVAALAQESVSAMGLSTLADATVKVGILVARGKTATPGLISASVAALVQGVGKTMVCSKIKLATVFFLAIGAGTMGLGVLRHQLWAAKPAATQGTSAQRQTRQDQGQPTANEHSPDSVRVSGIVFDPDGRPLPGAKLYLGPTNPNQPAFPVRAITGKDGRFVFTFAQSELDRTARKDSKGQVLAMVEGFGSDWTTIDLAAKDAELTLRLGKDVPINGRILNQDGWPVAGVQVRITGASAYPDRNLNDVLEDFRLGRSDKLNQSAHNWMGPLPGQAVTTGADGRIRLAGFGSDRIVWLHIEGPGIVAGGLKALTRPGEPIDLHRKDRFHGATFDYVAQTSRPVRGIVRDKTTHKPVAGVEISGISFPVKKVISDAEGRYEVLGLPKSERYDLQVRPANGQPYFAGWLRLSDSPGLNPLVANIELASASLVLRGRVTDQATGQPVPGAHVDYHALFPNPNIDKVSSLDMPHSEAMTGTDGTFSLAVLPGPGVVGATAPQPESYRPALITPKSQQEFFNHRLTGTGNTEAILRTAAGDDSMGFIVQQNYHALVLLDPDEQAAGLTRDLVLEPACTLQGSIVGPDGKPMTGVSAFGLTWRGSETLETDRFTVRGLNPQRARGLLFLQKEKGLGAYMDVRGIDSGPLKIQLRPCGSVSGRIVDRDGQPVPGMDLRIGGAGLSNLGQNHPLTTGKDGRFRVDGLVAGANYWIRSPAPQVLAEFVVESGQNQDLGDIRDKVKENP
ncbi:MAG TPA: sigma-70 family RNA polymerase sigma factor, partial [Gemmataceae bacterium]|nr:sigma-70 family RNA polymerase sigma factor [Gemmataceae bacterium]